MSESTRETFGHDTTTDEVLEGIDLSGKLALVTGGSGGLGAETARAFASKGAHVVTTARNLAEKDSNVEAAQSLLGNLKPLLDALENQLGNAPEQ